jgi:hypothetical protein
MAEDFIISGTGQVIRPGDRVWARPVGWDTNGPGVLVEVITGAVAVVRYDCEPDEAQFCPVNRLMREDDHERISGAPLWCWY